MRTSAPGVHLEGRYLRVEVDHWLSRERGVAAPAQLPVQLSQPSVKLATLFVNLSQLSTFVKSRHGDFFLFLASHPSDLQDTPLPTSWWLGC